MPLSPQDIIKKITKTKNKIIKSENYLQLQSAIKDFEKVKLHAYKIQHVSNDADKKKRKSQQQPKEQDNDVRKLVQTCQELIKEKIKYFKKLVIKKIDQAKKEKNDERKVKKERKDSQLNLLNNSSSQLNKSSSLLNKDYPSSLSGYAQFQELKKLQQSSKRFKKSPHHYQQSQPQFHTQTTTFLQKSRKSPSHSQKRLKQSKSVDNFLKDKIKESFTFRNENDIKRSHAKEDQTYYSQEQNRYEMDDDNKTQVKLFNKKNQPFDEIAYRQDQDLQFYKNKVLFLEQLIHSGMVTTGQLNSPLQNQLGETSQVFNHFHFKLREKSLELQEVKGRLIYYETTNQQLKNRLHNQQRRHQDYIKGLKEQIKSQQNTIYQSQKQKKLMSQLIKQLQFKIQVEQKQKLNYIEQIQSLLKQKQRSKQNDKNKTEDLRKQLEIMAKQQKCIKQLETVIKDQKIQFQIRVEKNNQLQGENTAFKEDLKRYSEQKEVLEQLLQLKLQEIQQFKVQVHQLQRQLMQCQAQNKNMKQQLAQWHNQQQQEQRKKEKLTKNKVQKLKELKTLLAEDV